jgi:diadenosine tetraphosphate (Ap4A) HIT family hydrolase
MFARIKPDTKAYRKRIQDGPCFICQIIADKPEYPHYIIYEDSIAIAFLDRYPTLYGQTLVAPKRHFEQVTADFSRNEYLQLQRRIYDITEAVRAELRAERVYVLSLGSQQGNAHVHWHIAPLPPGVPFEEQQLQALSWQNGILDLPAREMALLAARIRLRLITQHTAAHSWHLDVAG